MVVGWIIFYAVLFLIIFLLAGLRVVKEYQRGVKFTLGRYAGIMNPGLRLVIPVIQTWQRVDIRVRAIDVPDQDAITKDNVSIKVNAVLYFKAADAEKAVIEV
jgi:regulator of protease activity HflC (stomatin/prohibitin superfamily)